ncbi:related to Mitochondrial chaperone TCM62 [Zygosaccharomyces bailii]|nr:related to Mitochondrial chaperone TCM62 [Zygosaccharomyces bailii]
MLRQSLSGPFSRFIRTVKTLHTPIYGTEQLSTKQAFLQGIELLDNVVSSTTDNKSLLYMPKYNTRPKFITSKDTLRLQHVVREFLDGLQEEEVLTGNKRRDSTSRLAKVGLQLFCEIHDRNILPISTGLTLTLMKEYAKNPTSKTLAAILGGLDRIRVYLEQNIIRISSAKDIDALVDKLAYTKADSETTKCVLKALEYRLYSDDVVRVAKGRKTHDDIDVSKGWKFPAGILDTNEAYLRSVELPQKKLVSVDEEMIVLIYDGILREANDILPTLHYAAKAQKSLLLMVTGDCTGDALAAIVIANNRNRRQGIKSQSYIIKYDRKSNGGLSLHENYELVQFLRLPMGFASVYSPTYCAVVPSKQSANQYYGKIDSLKATTGEAFLYNSAEWSKTDLQNSFMQMTVTVNVGAATETELDQRRNYMDNLINDILCHGLSKGFIPGCNVSLAKAIPVVNQLAHDAQHLDTKLGYDAVVMALAQAFERSMFNLHGYNNFTSAALLAETIRDPNFSTAQIEPNKEPQDLKGIGILDPWDKVDKCLANVATFMKLLASCNKIVTQVFEPPKKKA